MGASCLVGLVPIDNEIVAATTALAVFPERGWRMSGEQVYIGRGFRVLQTRMRILAKTITDSGLKRSLNLVFSDQ